MRSLKANFPKYLAQRFEQTHETFMRHFPVNFHPMRSESLLQYFRAIINQLIGFESCNFFCACHSRHIVDLPGLYRFIENCFGSLFAAIFSYEVDGTKQSSFSRNLDLFYSR